MVDLGVDRVIRNDRDEWVPMFTGPSARQFRRLVRIAAVTGLWQLVAAWRDHHR
ncbi:hypothetical protein AGRA3207_002190 [Actinomadura graeca]|uniref:Uncharacterized protein n=1 Tax=Actinomadura graeca TaxID=2750812 RepID=A0ABX8QRL7_9ACTN|nr:hypothetical protein [Actinomadura graeca]QXJ21346.1 hypothetical protein AGRA3207_002190 [Actinomadura graeca]